MGRKSRDKRDAYYRLAKEDGYRARAAYKLIQLDASLDLLGENVHRVVDLCAAPGGWSQVVVEKRRHVICVAVDLKEMAPIEGAQMIVGDITAKDTVDQVLGTLHGEADLVLCDGAPDIYGRSDIDDFLQCRLVFSALAMAEQVLAPGGTFVAKLYRERSGTDLLLTLKKKFTSVSIAKPRCSRAASVEAFLVCQGYGEPSLHISKSFVPFIACGNTDTSLDADASYPLELFPHYKFRRPVMGPIKPSHLAATTPAFTYENAGYQRYHTDENSQDTKADHRKSPYLKTQNNTDRLALPTHFRPSPSVSFERDSLPPPANDTASLRAWLQHCATVTSNTLGS